MKKTLITLVALSLSLLLPACSDVSSSTPDSSVGDSSTASSPTDSSSVSDSSSPDSTSSSSHDSSSSSSEDSSSTGEEGGSTEEEIPEGLADFDSFLDSFVSSIDTASSLLSDGDDEYEIAENGYINTLYSDYAAGEISYQSIEYIDIVETDEEDDETDGEDQIYYTLTSYGEDMRDGGTASSGTRLKVDDEKANDYSDPTHNLYITEEEAKSNTEFDIVYDIYQWRELYNKTLLLSGTYACVQYDGNYLVVTNAYRSAYETYYYYGIEATFNSDCTLNEITLTNYGIVDWDSEDNEPTERPTDGNSYTLSEFRYDGTDSIDIDTSNYFLTEIDPATITLTYSDPLNSFGQSTTTPSDGYIVQASGSGTPEDALDAGTLYIFESSDTDIISYSSIENDWVVHGEGEVTLTIGNAFVTTEYITTIEFGTGGEEGDEVENNEFYFTDADGNPDITFNISGTSSDYELFTLHVHDGEDGSVLTGPYETTTDQWGTSIMDVNYSATSSGSISIDSYSFSDNTSSSELWQFGLVSDVNEYDNIVYLYGMFYGTGTITITVPSAFATTTITINLGVAEDTEYSEYLLTDEEGSYDIDLTLSSGSEEAIPLVVIDPETLESENGPFDTDDSGILNTLVYTENSSSSMNYYTARFMDNTQNSDIVQYLGIEADDTDDIIYLYLYLSWVTSGSTIEFVIDAGVEQTTTITITIA